MAVDVKKLIAAISPDVFCDDTPDNSGVKLNKKVKELVKKEGYLRGAEIAKLRNSDYIDIFHSRFSKGAYKLEGTKFPIENHKLIYDEFSQSLEPIYFWILDYVNEEFEGAEKLLDNFVASPGGGHVAEMSRRGTVLQEEAMKMMQTVGVIIKSIINIIYDLKEFKLRLGLYDDLKSDDNKKKEAARLSLKQIWMDNVDITRQNTAIKIMAQQFDYVTLIDAFMAADNLDDVNKLDLNDRVKNILKQRVSEFNRWLGESEKELRKRFEIERIYLKNQVNSVRMYARWVKPYLRAARQLEQSIEGGADVVNMFNTSVFQLTLLARDEYNPEGDIARGELPYSFKKMKLRKYSPITIIEFKFRSAPDRPDQRGGYAFRGRVEVEFTSFALNESELKILKEQISEDDFGDVYRMMEGMTSDSLAQLKGDLDELLGDKSMDGNEIDEKGEDANPFSSLFSFFKWKKEEEADLSKGIPKDSSAEEIIRSQAILESRVKCRKLYDDYKKEHGMEAFPPVFIP